MSKSNCRGPAVEYLDPFRAGVLDTMTARNPHPAPPNMTPGPNWWHDGRELWAKIGDARRPAPTVEELAARLGKVEALVARMVDLLAGQDGGE